MRIVCQKCSAAYAIDDKLVTPKGIRAQCPRCRHLQLVKSDAPATQPQATSPSSSGPPLAPPKAAAAAKDPFFDFAAPPTQQATVTGGSTSVLFDGKPAARTGSPCIVCAGLPGQLAGTAATVLIGG